ncbi:MAG: primosomal protein N' [Ruminococcus sp.]|nr:primosomal protein N' [Ruminococcus sp.]
MAEIAEIAVSGTAYSFDMLFSYIVPQGVNVRKGCRVLVPFGRGNRRRIGIVMGFGSAAANLKPIAAQIDSEPVLSEELLNLVFYLHDYTFCTYYDAVKAMLPPAMGIKSKECFRLSEKSPSSELSGKASELLEQIRYADNSNLLTEMLDNYIAANGRTAVDELIEADVLESESNFRQNVCDASIRMIRLSSAYLSANVSFSLTPKQKKAAEFLAEYGSVSVKEAAYMCGCTESVLKRLAASGAAEIFDMELLRSADEFPAEKIEPDSIILSDEQQKVHDRVYSQIEKRESAVFLLHGVTGSGKTSVFEKLIYNTLSSGRGSILLIPEIALTPQVVRRFRSLFGERIAVIHSGLSLGQRLDEYKRIKRGDADIIIGTRSAVFAPVENIGLIIIDEEGERSYKSESSPRYYAHDIAKKRCAYHGAVLLLASATPSVESFYMTEKGVYNLLKIEKRYNDIPLPEVSVVDMNMERMNGNTSEFSRKLTYEVSENLKRGEQSILLLNRRGFHTIISCMDCFQPVYCPNCSVPMTFHKKNSMLMCHYCGFSCEPVSVCPVCGSDRLKSMGFGTQRLEDELGKLFPEARILRMDADTTFSRYSYEKGFSAFRNGEYDIMVGTQMIGKGLDFPNVTLVGVMSVDKSLYSGDFRSYERTFSLITQVVGRGGRGNRRGRAVLQTFMPEHYVMNLAALQDYRGFYNEEVAIRRAMIYPPLCDMCVFCFSGADEDDVKSGAEAVLGFMSRRLKEIQPKTPIRVLGPVKAAYGRLNGRFRYRIIMKCKNTAEMRQFISGVLKEGARLKEMKKVAFYADMNGDTGV